MTPTTYDEIADWYEDVFLAGLGDADPLGVEAALNQLLGHGSGRCLDLGCGTGAHAATLASLGWTPVGIDSSSGMLSRVQGRLPIARARAEQLPFADQSLPAVVSLMVHTDMADYPAVLVEGARVLEPGGVLVHVGVHPCFCGGFADRSDPSALVITPGYVDRHWTKASWTESGIRDKVGGTHFPLPELLGAFVDAGLVLEGFCEGGSPAPVVFALRARRWPR